MVRPYPPTLALPSASVSGVKWAGKIPNISLESSSQTAGTITEKAAAPGTEAFEAHPIQLETDREFGCRKPAPHRRSGPGSRNNPPESRPNVVSPCARLWAARIGSPASRTSGSGQSAAYKRSVWSVEEAFQLRNRLFGFS